MNNLFFKSPETYEKLLNKLETIQKEQRHNRLDIAMLLRNTSSILNTLNLQKQVDEYFEEDSEDTAEQTDNETKKE